jgi:integrase
MPSVKISRRSVEALLPQSKTYIVYDKSLPGFGVRITQSGAKSWIVDYRGDGGGRGAATRRITIGKLSLVTAHQARREARRILARVRLGSDPASERASLRCAATIKTIADDYMETEIVVPKRAAATVALYKGFFRLYVIPELGSKRAREVTHADIDRLHRKIGAATQVTANRVIALITALFNWAATSRDGKPNRYSLPRGFNPALGITRYPEEGCERYLTSEELVRLGDAVREAETIGIPYEVDATKPKAKHARKPDNRRTNISPYAAAALRLLIFTGARLREILHLKWTDVDFERAILFLKKSKNGRKPIVLNAPALTILTSLPRLGPYVIAGQSAGGKNENEERPRSDLNRPWRAIRVRARLADVRIHDLRHSFASIGVGAGMGLPIVGKLLGHRHTSTTERYAHLDADPLRVASDRIGAKIAAAFDGNPIAEVLPLRARA